jgi:NAD(P)-dependent dehydrogenase (short-subunit alcohol dehydrogenase family)
VADEGEGGPEAPVALVTGASRGIGRATAVALARRGLDVAVTGRTVREGEGRVGDVPVPGSLERTAEEIAALGRRSLPVAMDVMDRTSIRDAYEAVIEAWGRVDVLVNNAPYSGPGSDDRILDIDLDLASRVVEGNYLHQLFLVQLALPAMLARGGGTIVSLASGSALVAPPAPAGEGGWSLAYCASKAAFHQLAVVLDVEYRAAGIRAFNLEPGYVVTERTIALGGGEDTYGRHFRGDPPEVPGEVIGWLATDPGADRYLGRMVHAQALCARLGLVPGWEPAGPGA